MTDTGNTKGGIPTISFVIPCFNEEDVIAETHKRLVLSSEGKDAELEFLYVDDGSKDNTLSILKEIAGNDDRVHILSFSRNFGHQTAVTAGIDYAGGDAVIIMDADLQDPPEVAWEMVDLWREGYHVVYGQRKSRDGETRLKLVTANLFYRLLDSVSDIPIPRNVGDFRLIDRVIVEALRDLPERVRFVRALVPWVGYRQTAVHYDRPPRFAGETKYPYTKLIRMAFDGIFSFSVVPLKLAGWLGFLSAVLSVVGIFYALFLRLFTGIWVPGWTLMFIALLFIGGTQLISLGIIGEYLGRTFMETKRRPLYLLAEQIGFKKGSGFEDRTDANRPLRRD